MLNMMVDDTIRKAVARQTTGISAGLDEMEPGPFLGIVLSGIDVGALCGDDRITVLRARQRMESHYAAQKYEAMASIVTAYQEEEGQDYEGAADGAAYELRAALQLTRRAAEVELSFALDLRDRLPRVADALSSGAIDQRRARTIVWQTTHLDDDTARAVTDRIIGDAPGLTTGQLIARIRELAITVDPDTARRRYEQAVTDRRVVVEPTGDGTANLYALDLPPDRAIAARRHVDRLARSLRGPSEERSMDQLRADVCLDLLCGMTVSGKGGVVDIRVDLDTLVGLSDHPGELAGYGPVIDDITRQVVARQSEADWRYTVTHNGHPVATGTTRRRPTTGQRRVVEATHTTCIFPGCRMPANQCDLDHRIEWSKSHRTDVDDLGPCCRHDHVGRHEFGWTYQILHNGDIEWTSPLGRTYNVKSRDP
ncbi:MAG: HNH endonuclease [Acidimicrobiia bacterium]|nr:HNH endonuclease [Acidimicrobiia bacterium]